MSFSTASAILRGHWAIEKGYAHGHLPLIARLLSGENVSFGYEKPQIENPIPVQVAAATGVFVVGHYTNPQSVPHGSIAVVDLIGPVMKYGDACSYGSVDHVELITKLAQAPNIGAIILNIDSPGGQVSGTTMLGDAIRYAATQKPVVSVVDDGVAASAAMWFGTAAHEFYTTKKSDMVGSIGVFFTLADFSEALKMKGINVREIYAPQSTEKNDITRTALAGNDELLIEELRITADDFIQTIEENRGTRLTSDKWKTGKMFRAPEAVKMGLIDGVKSWAEVIERTQQLIANFSQNTNTQMSNKANTATIGVAGDVPVAFARIMAAAGIEAITVCDAGFALDEAALNALENVLATHQSGVDALQSAVAQLETTVEGLNATITEREGRITELESEVATQASTILELEALTPGFRRTTTTADAAPVGDATAKDEFLTSIDQEKARRRALLEGEE